MQDILDRSSSVQLDEHVMQQIKDYVQAFPHNSVFLFGSRAKGNANSRSDIDIGVFSEKGISVVQKIELDELLQDLPILQKVELVDFSEEVTDEFRELALRNIFYLN